MIGDEVIKIGRGILWDEVMLMEIRRMYHRRICIVHEIPDLSVTEIRFSNLFNLFVYLYWITSNAMYLSCWIYAYLADAL